MCTSQEPEGAGGGDLRVVQLDAVDAVRMVMVIGEGIAAARYHAEIAASERDVRRWTWVEENLTRLQDAFEELAGTGAQAVRL